MKAPFLLLVYSMKRMRALVLATGFLLAAFQVLLVFVARSIQDSAGFEQLAALLPPFARELLGPSLTSVLSFGGIVCVGYFHVAVMGSLVAVSLGLAATPASEIETGFIDLVLSRPLRRHWIVSRSILLLLLSIALLLGLMMAGTWAGLEAFAPASAPWPSARLISSLALNLGFLMLAWSGVALAIACASRRRATAGAIAGLLALGAFLVDYAGRLWQPAESIARLSPFRYYSPFDLVMGNPLPHKNLVVLAAIAAAGFAAAYVVFAHRDIAR